MNRRLEIGLIGLLGAIAGAGIVVSTTRDLGPLTVLAIPDWFQLPGIILVGVLIGFASRNSPSAFGALLIASIVGGALQGFAIGISAAGAERAAVQLINRGTVQSFYAFIVIFFMGMVGVVIALGVNNFARRAELQE